MPLSINDAFADCGTVFPQVLRIDEFPDTAGFMDRTDPYVRFSKVSDFKTFAFSFRENNFLGK
jgi:hypothetical protein